MSKPFSPACERNSKPIFDVLKTYVETGNLLEIGSGTGQHAVYMAKHLPLLEWTCSDVESHHSGIESWIKESDLPNINGPATFQIGRDSFPSYVTYQYVFASNVLHIMSWSECNILFQLLGDHLLSKSLVFFYGPFNYGGQYTSEGNQHLDEWLKQSVSVDSAIRDFEEVESAMKDRSFRLRFDHEMPANNRLLVFEKK